MTKKRKTHRMETRLERDTGPCEPRTMCGRVSDGLALAEYGTVPSCKICRRMTGLDEAGGGE